MRESFSRFGLLGENVKFVKGLFQDSLPGFIVERGDRPIAVLRMDNNFYDGTIRILYDLYERVPVGGFVIFDD